MSINHLDTIAIRKAASEGWEPYKYQVVEPDAFLVTGGVPRLITRGTRKGQKKWEGKGTMVVVTKDEIAAEKTRFTAETGNCAECGGDGRAFASWHYQEGTKYKPCPHCNGTGNAAVA